MDGWTKKIEEIMSGINNGVGKLKEGASFHRKLAP
jgi:hypothetical protein